MLNTRFGFVFEAGFKAAVDYHRGQLGYLRACGVG